MSAQDRVSRDDYQEIAEDLVQRLQNSPVRPGNRELSDRHYLGRLAARKFSGEVPGFTMSDVAEPVLVEFGRLIRDGDAAGLAARAKHANGKHVDVTPEPNAARPPAVAPVVGAGRPPVSRAAGSPREERAATTQKGAHGRSPDGPAGRGE